MQRREFIKQVGLGLATVAGTTAASQPDVTNKNEGDTVVDGGATWKRLL